MAVILAVSPYADDALNLPVASAAAAIPFYRDVLGFSVVSKSSEPYNSVVLQRDGLEVGLVENGGDPSQEGCFFEVDNVEEMFATLQANGLRQKPNYRVDKYGESSFKVFFVVAPDGLCYCYGERQ
ncbi:MAG: VOC family protein [Rhodothermales bacterium]